jgi:integrase
MAVLQVGKENETKDGRKWYFKTRIVQKNGLTKQYKSRKYLSRTEAVKAERDLLSKIDRREINPSDMTFKQLYEEFYEYKSDKVKHTTMRTYRERVKYFTTFDNIKIMDFDIKHYLKWRASINSLPLAVKTKNHYHKFFKEILNYGAKWHDFNFSSIYNKMEKFVDPNATPKEMDFYTYEEFKQFISVETEVKFKGVFEMLYYCGLRRGELRGLTWDNIDLRKKLILIVKRGANK